jgi:predicted nucleic acid-binding protein
MPDDTRLVVVNTSPIISLSLVHKLPLLRDLYQQVIIPPAVRQEALRGGARSGVAELRRADWVHTMPLQDPSRADLLSDLDRGEAEVLALAQENHADLVIIDERLARRHAQRLGLSLTGTLGVLLRAKKNGLVTEVRPLIEQIHRNGIRLGKLLIEETLKLAGEL